MPPPPTPQLVLGPYYFGVALNTFLYGVLFLQILIYFQGYKRDQFWLRLFVLYLFFVETVNTGICVAMIYEPLIGQFGTDGPISLFPTLLAGREENINSRLIRKLISNPSKEPFLEIAISAPVQFFYAWRIRVIMKRDWIPALICLSSLASTAGAIWTGICVHQAHIYQNKDIINHPALIWSICSAGSDVIISTTLITVLIKRKTGIKTTDDTVNRIIRTTVQTGAITGSFAVLDIVLFLALPNSTLSFTFDFALPKLYSNALVSTLNARAGMVQLSLRQPQDNVLFSEQPLGSSVGQSNAAETSTFNGPIVFNASPNLDYIEMNSVTLNGDTGIGYAGNLSKARVP